MSNYAHADLADDRWNQMTLAEQMGNIGSEISRSIRWKNKGNHERMFGAVDRALELLSLSVKWATIPQNRESHPGALRELCRLQEVVCDYFLWENEFASTDSSLLKYFDQFALVARR